MSWQWSQGRVECKGCDGTQEANRPRPSVGSVPQRSSSHLAENGAGGDIAPVGGNAATARGLSDGRGTARRGPRCKGRSGRGASSKDWRHVYRM